ncbi:hypothetical protein DFH07DRAFT_983792 [Mycena maculata]|uniref:F-box domain-containing protein n=1 Tax=Mycena maculata TaxID=230809 RepID=A0AAD7ICN2_9AGAR|nr:hypothetical protein DFH07DRAFT_983792 [Mycena maculata]
MSGRVLATPCASPGRNFVGPTSKTQIPDKVCQLLALENPNFGQGNDHFEASKTQISGQPLGRASRGLIDACRPELARYDAEIQRLQTLPFGFVSDRANLVSYIAGCQSALAPIRRLPTELLANIFEMGSPPIEVYNVGAENTPAQELDRLAQRHLLQLSQVSSDWHRVVMSTPGLWSIITVDITLWDACPVSFETLLSLLSSTLIRGQSCPLNLLVVIGDSGHSATRPRQEIDLFEAAPRLNEVAFYGPPAEIQNLPWGQLQKFQYSADTGRRPHDGLALIQNLAPGTSFTFDVSQTSSQPTFVHSIKTSRRARPSIAHSAVLATLRFMHSPLERDTPVWHQPSFMDLASRSSFQNHLTVLKISIRISEDELLECLTVLPLLEELYITDPADGGYNLITDTLLGSLEWEPEQAPLVPRLLYLCSTSFLRFTESAFLDFVTSRIAWRSDEETKFCVALLPCPGSNRELGPDAIARLSELEGELCFSWFPAVSLPIVSQP